MPKTGLEKIKTTDTIYSFTIRYTEKYDYMRYKIKKLNEIDSNLCDTLRRFCYDINGCCQTVHKELGPFLNEYMYQDALEIMFKEVNLKYEREHYFHIDFRGQEIKHRHYVDFKVKEKVFIECKAVECLCPEHRQQLWNYMRLTKTRIGILWNFAPILDQNEHYYLDINNNIMYTF